MISDAPPSRMHYPRFTQNDFEPESKINLEYSSSREIIVGTSCLSERANAGGIVVHITSALYKHLSLAVGFRINVWYSECRQLLELNKREWVHDEQ